MVYFISDLHLGARYIADPRAHEARVTAFLESIADDATELYLLGDILDYWFEYREVVPRGHVRFFGALARLADRGVKITWLTGNHDIWLFDYLSKEIGLEVVDTPYMERVIGGKRFILAHGDRIGRQKPTFRLMSAFFRNPVCQKMYSAIHPRWTIPFATGWSRSSRLSSTDTQAEPPADYLQTVVRQSSELAAMLPDYIIIGHFHYPITTQLTEKTELVVLGDWISRDSYARFDGRDLSLHVI